MIDPTRSVSGQESSCFLYTCLSTLCSPIARLVASIFSCLSCLDRALQNPPDLSRRNIVPRNEPFPLTEEEADLLSSCQKYVDFDVRTKMPDCVKGAPVEDRTEVLKALKLLCENIEASFQMKEVESSIEEDRRKKITEIEWLAACNGVFRRPKGNRLAIISTSLPCWTHMTLFDAVYFIRVLPDLTNEQAQQLEPLASRDLCTSLALQTLLPFIELAISHDKLQEMVDLILLCTNEKNLPYPHLEVVEKLLPYLHDNPLQLIDFLPQIIGFFSQPPYKELPITKKSGLVSLVYQISEIITLPE